MKILVVDDNLKHLAAAEELRQAGHEIEILSDYVPALDRLKKGTDVEVLLTDRNMPAEDHCLGPKGLQYLGHPLDIGFVLLIRAAQSGVKFGAMITDSNHHDDPMVAAIDWIYGQMPITICDMKVIIGHAPIKNGAKDWLTTLEQLLHS